jgi:hypothetical protein
MMKKFYRGDLSYRDGVKWEQPNYGKGCGMIYVDGCSGLRPATCYTTLISCARTAAAEPQVVGS